MSSVYVGKDAIVAALVDQLTTYEFLNVVEDCQDCIMSTNGFAYDKNIYQFFKIGEKVE